MAYAQVADLKARAGRLAPSWTRDSVPGDADLEKFLAYESALVDAALLSRGYALPAAGTAAAHALQGVVADGALLLALAGTFPSNEGPAAAQELVRTVTARYDHTWGLINGGTHSVVMLLESTDPDQPGASNFWDTEPGYGQIDPAERASINPYLQPEAERGMRL